jgi:hypothetical protein
VQGYFVFFPGGKQWLMKNEPVGEGTLLSPRGVAKPIRRVFVPGLPLGGKGENLLWGLRTTGDFFLASALLILSMFLHGPVMLKMWIVMTNPESLRKERLYNKTMIGFNVLRISVDYFGL